MFDGQVEKICPILTHAKLNYVRRFAITKVWSWHLNLKWSWSRSIYFRNWPILTSGSGTGRACWFHHRPLRHLPVTESFALPPDLKVECNDRSSSRNSTARNSATPLPEMPNAHDAFAHLAGAYRIRTAHVRLLQMRSCRKNRHSVRSNEVRRCWLARWRIAAANVGCASARRYRKARIENTRSRSFAGRDIHCRRNHNRCPILISLFQNRVTEIRRWSAHIGSRCVVETALGYDSLSRS